MAESAEKLDSLIIRPVSNEDELAMVHRLTHDAYVAMGYASPQPDRRFVHYGDYDHLPETTVLVAMRANELVGSLSVTLDGPWGLTVEKEFKKICDSLRYAGRSLAVFWRFVIVKSENPSRQILMNLIKHTIDLTAMQGANTILYTVNPRHQAVYERLLHATIVSSNNFTKGLDHAPGVLLRMDYERLPSHWKTVSPIAQKGRVD